MLSRRHFIQLGAGLAVGVALDGCASNRRDVSAPVASPPGSPPGSTPASTPGHAVDTSVAEDAARHVLVIVQLNGGNDALNTLVPSDGRYRDARPTLAIAEADLVALRGVSEWSLHPSLAALAPYFAAGTASFLPGIGFDDPDRSHFVAMDRWWRADAIGATTGWLGRVLDRDRASVDAPLLATALGSGAPQLRGEYFQPVTVLQPSSFALPRLLDASLFTRAARPTSASALAAQAQEAFLASVGAVGSFVELLGDSRSQSSDVPTREGGFDLVQGLDIAAKLAVSDLGVRVVVVSVGGFDTHANQAATQKSLLSDLGAGVDAFMKSVALAGASESVLLATTTEFGRRVQQNGSEGTDHGAGGLSMMFGPMVAEGIHGAVDLGDLLDGDIRPSLDPRTLYTACLDWLGADVEASLGKRYEQVALLA